MKKALTSTLKQNTKGGGRPSAGCPPLATWVRTHTLAPDVYPSPTDTLVGIFEHVEGEEAVLMEKAVQFVQESVQSLRGEVFGPGQAGNERELMENIKKVRGGVVRWWAGQQVGWKWWEVSGSERIHMVLSCLFVC